MQQRLLSDLLSSEPRYAGDIAKQLSILATEEYFNGVDRLTMGGPEGLHSISYADILSILSEVIRGDMSMIAKADRILSNLLEQISGNTNITAQEFNYLYKQMLSAEGITFSGLLEAQNRLSDFKNIFGQFDDVEELLSKDPEELKHWLDRVRDSGLLDALINNNFNAAANAVPLRADPLVFDLDGDGIETIAADGNVLFDHTGDGVKYASGWVGADDALLVRDLDQNGQIDNGLELFGDNTIKANGEKATDGFDALSDLDDNADGVFDHNDTTFDALKLWQDSNQDGVVQEDELKSLDDVNISSIDLNAINDGSGATGGVIAKKSTYNTINGESYTIAALDFNANLFYREYHDDFNHQFADELETMDLAFNMQGSGAVRDLNQAALLNPDIANVVQNITQTNSYKERIGLYHTLVSEWSQSAEEFTSAITTLEGLVLDSGAKISFEISDETRQRLEKIAVLEAFNFSHMLDYAITENGVNSEIQGCPI